MKIRPKNWREFQHYKDRSPPWIRLHRKLLDDRDFHQLPIESKALAPMLWLLAAETVDGSIHGDHAELAFRLRCSEKEIGKGLKPLIERGFFVEAGDVAESDDSLSPSQAAAKANGYGTRHIADSVKREVWVRDCGQCRSCSATENIEYDHVVPVSKGGTSDVDNVQLLCRTCNRKKRAKTVEQLATPAQPDLNSRTPEAEAEAEAEGAAQPPLEKPPRERKPRRSTRVPEDFVPDLDFALAELPDLDVQREIQKFRDWEFKSAKTDWAATWRTWVRGCRDSGKYAKVNGSGRNNGLQTLNPH